MKRKKCVKSCFPSIKMIEKTMNRDKMLVNEALVWGKEKLAKAGIENAQMEAYWILASQLNPEIKAFNLLLKGRELLKAEQIQRYENLIGERSKNIPLSYILGFQEFFNL